MLSNNLILCHLLLLPPSIFRSIRVFFQWVSSSQRWPKYWSFGFNISPSNEYSGLSSFRMDWLDLLQPKGLSRVFPKPHFKGINSLGLAFFIVQLSHAYMTTGKTIALTRWTFLGKVMSLLLNMLYRLAFLPRSKHLLISWLQSPSAVIFGAPKTKVSHCFHCLPGVCHDQIPWS